VSLHSSGSAVAHIWGPRTYSVDESLVLRKRDFHAKSITGGAVGAYAYAEVALTGSGSPTYVLTVKASTR